jgi:hypothetical protein
MRKESPMKETFKVWMLVLAALLPRFGMAQAATEHRTVHLDALHYENVDIRKLFPFNASAANP